MRGVLLPAKVELQRPESLSHLWQAKTKQNKTKQARNTPKTSIWNNDFQDTQSQATSGKGPWGKEKQLSKANYSSQISAMRRCLRAAWGGEEGQAEPRAPRWGGSAEGPGRLGVLHSQRRAPECRAGPKKDSDLYTVLLEGLAKSCSARACEEITPRTQGRNQPRGSEGTVPTSSQGQQDWTSYQPVLHRRIKRDLPQSRWKAGQRGKEHCPWPAGQMVKQDPKGSKLSK